MRCLTCGQVFPELWGLECPQCVNNKLLREQNRILQNQSSKNYSSDSGYSSTPANTEKSIIGLIIFATAIFILLTFFPDFWLSKFIVIGWKIITIPFQLIFIILGGR